MWSLIVLFIYKGATLYMHTCGVLLGNIQGDSDEEKTPVGETNV